LLYIPHGSDESLPALFAMFAIIVLYIPHGSDESPEDRQKAITILNFISHMVQMKE